MNVAPEPPSFLWVHRGRGFRGWGHASAIGVGSGPDRFRVASEEALGVLSEHPEGARAVGCFTFDPAPAGSVLFVPQRIEKVDTPVHTSAPGATKVRYAGAAITEIDWLESVAEATRRIGRGDLEKVVLSRAVEVWSEVPLDLGSLAYRLAVRFPDCYTFLCDGLVGSSPELLVRRSGEWVESLVLAGSAPRSGDETEDELLGRSLMSSAKDDREHEISVRSVVEALGESCTDLEVGERTLLRLANVQHVATRIRGRLSRPATALELAGVLHPTAAVGGAPREAALRSIHELESYDRGRYAGPVGWMDGTGDGEWAIALRCGQFDGSRGRLFAGAGIVDGSVPERELEETRVKLRAMQAALEEPGESRPASVREEARW